MDYNFLIDVYKNALDLDECIGDHIQEGKVAEALEGWLLGIFLDLYEDADDSDGEREVNPVLTNHRVQAEIKRLERTTDWDDTTPEGHLNILGEYVAGAVREIFKKELGL